MWDTRHDGTHADYPNRPAGEPYALHYSSVTWLLLTTKTAYYFSRVLNMAWSLSTDAHSYRSPTGTCKRCSSSGSPSHTSLLTFLISILFALSSYRLWATFRGGGSWLVRSSPVIPVSTGFHCGITFPHMSKQTFLLWPA